MAQDDDARAGLTAAVRSVCDIVRTTLGPFGANKLVVQQIGAVTISSVGSLVLDRLDVDNPAVTLLEQAAEDFRGEHGDGSSTVVALAGALLDEADRLIDMGLHPTSIERGYYDALAVATDRLETGAYPLSEVGTTAVARTALTTVRHPQVRDHLGDALDRAATTLIDRHGAEAFDHGRVRVVARLGGAQSETDLVEGVVLDKGPVSQSMPRDVSGGIALFSSTIDVETIGGEFDRTSNVELTFGSGSFEERAAFGDREREGFREDLEAAIDAGMEAIATERAVNERVQRLLENYGILALQRVDEDEFDRLARITGGTVVGRLPHVTPETLGRAEVSVERKAGRDMTTVRSGGHPDAEPVYTLFCRAPDPRTTDSFEHTAENALAAVASASRSGLVVPGGGAAEMAAAHAVRDAARSIDSREQLAAEAFGRALTTLPRTLANNAGMDGQVSLTRLHVNHSEGRHAVGVDAIDSELRDVTVDDPVVDPLEIKREVWEAATDLAVKLIRIDARLPATDLGDDESGSRQAEAPGR